MSRAESPLGTPDERYATAARALHEWREHGVLKRDSTPAFYVYEQVTDIAGSSHTRRGFFARLQLTPFTDGIVRPHERTMSGPKVDRLQLLKATQTNISPIFMLYRDPEGIANALLADVTTTEPIFEAKDGRGDQHRLWIIDDESRIEVLRKAAAASKATIADGHHRYETALNHLATSSAKRHSWVLACLVTEDDPGLVVLPTHRLVAQAAPKSDFITRLEALFTIEQIGEAPAGATHASDHTAVEHLWNQMQARASEPGTLGVIGIDNASLHLLRPRSTKKIDAAMPPSWSTASRSLDVLILSEVILGPLLGIDAKALEGGRVEFTEEIVRAWKWTLSEPGRLAFLVNPTRVEQVTAVADAGEVMPQKATFFYPKLATGMVLNQLD